MMRRETRTFHHGGVSCKGCSRHMGSGVHGTSYVWPVCSQHIRSGYDRCSLVKVGWLLHIGCITPVWMFRICGGCSFLLPLYQFYERMKDLLLLVPPSAISVCQFGVCVPLPLLCRPGSVGHSVGIVLFSCSSSFFRRRSAALQSWLSQSMILLYIVDSHIV